MLIDIIKCNKLTHKSKVFFLCRSTLFFTVIHINNPLRSQALLIILQDPIVETGNSILTGNLHRRAHTRQKSTTTTTLPLLLLTPLCSGEPRTQPWWAISSFTTLCVFFRITSPWIIPGTCIEVFEVVDFFTDKRSNSSSCPYGDLSSHW